MKDRRVTETYQRLLKQIEKDDAIEKAIICGLRRGITMQDRYIAILTALDEAGYTITKKQSRRTK